MRIGWAVAVFFAMAVLDHLMTATACRSTYEHDLLVGIARLRRVEYSLRATSVDILIGFHSSITSIKAVAGANAGMILFDWIQERINPPGRTTPR